MEGFEVPKWLEWLILLIVGIAGKLGWDAQVKKRPVPTLSDAIPGPDDHITQRDTWVMWINNQIHKTKNEVNGPITVLSAKVASQEIRIARTEDDIKQLRIDLNEKISGVHQHLESAYDKLDKKLDDMRSEQRDSITRIWNKLDKL